jgi:hypothetical protein
LRLAKATYWAKKKNRPRMCVLFGVFLCVQHVHVCNGKHVDCPVSQSPNKIAFVYGCLQKRMINIWVLSGQGFAISMIGSNKKVVHGLG